MLLNESVKLSEADFPLLLLEHSVWINDTTNTWNPRLSKPSFCKMIKRAFEQKEQVQIGNSEFKALICMT